MKQGNETGKDSGTVGSIGCITLELPSAGLASNEKVKA